MKGQPNLAAETTFKLLTEAAGIIPSKAKVAWESPTTTTDLEFPVFHSQNRDPIMAVSSQPPVLKYFADS
jgi:hypothetical protein